MLPSLVSRIYRTATTRYLHMLGNGFVGRQFLPTVTDRHHYLGGWVE